jgi:glycerol dehydrogenase-like iron-containing ADH family enzyme
MSDTPVSWVISGLATTIATLTSALAFMFRLSESKSASSIAALESRIKMYETRLDKSEQLHLECLQDRVGLAERLGTVQGQVELLTKQIEMCKKQIGNCAVIGVSNGNHSN